MSFLTSLMGGAGAAAGAGAAGALGAAAPAAAAVNPMAGGLAKLLGTDGANVTGIADKIGGGMNQIAAAGGAQPGYQAPPVGGVQPGPMQPDPNNHLQLLDDDVLQGLIARFRPSARGPNQMDQF